MPPADRQLRPAVHEDDEGRLLGAAGEVERPMSGSPHDVLGHREHRGLLARRAIRLSCVTPLFFICSRTTCGLSSASWIRDMTGNPPNREYVSPRPSPRAHAASYRTPRAACPSSPTGGFDRRGQ